MASADRPASSLARAGSPAVIVGRYAVGLLTAGAALAALRLQPALLPGIFLLFSMAVLAAAWAGGFVAGLIAAITAAVGARELGFEPFSAVTLARVSDQVQLILFALLSVGFALIAVFSALEGGRALVIALAATVLALWMAGLARRALARRP